jgi:polyisoprenoid-binding protein YceI
METVQASTTPFMIDAAASKFTVQAFASGLLSSFGHSPTFAVLDFDGAAVFQPDAPESASLRLKIRTCSLSMQDNVKEKDKQEIEETMQKEVLETEKYPEIVFETSRVAATKIGDGEYRADISGTLNLHGVTKNHTITANLSVKGDILRATGSFPLRQTDYGIKLVSAAAGALKVKDEVKFFFDIQAKRSALTT